LELFFALFTNPAGGFIIFGIIMAILAAVKFHKKDLEAAEKRKKAFAAAQEAAKANVAKEAK
jgi:hypothetical protein